MKTLFVTLVLLAANFSFAADVDFQKESPLPAELKTLINKTLQERCQSLRWSNETGTEAVEVRVDQGVTDTYYTTEISSSYIFDGAHPLGTYITVKSVQWSVSNPAATQFEILEVSDTSGACK